MAQCCATVTICKRGLVPQRSQRDAARPALAVPVGQRRDAVHPVKGAAECVDGGEAALLGDFRNAVGAEPEQTAGAFQAHPAEMAAKADAARFAETGTEMA